MKSTEQSFVSVATVPTLVVVVPWAFVATDTQKVVLTITSTGADTGTCGLHRDPQFDVTVQAHTHQPPSNAVGFDAPVMHYASCACPCTSCHRCPAGYPNRENLQANNNPLYAMQYPAPNFRMSDASAPPPASFQVPTRWIWLACQLLAIASTIFFGPRH